MILIMGPIEINQPHDSVKSKFANYVSMWVSFSSIDLSQIARNITLVCLSVISYFGWYCFDRLSNQARAIRLILHPYMYSHRVVILFILLVSCSFFPWLLVIDSVNKQNGGRLYSGDKCSCHARNFEISVILALYHFNLYLVTVN